MQRNIQKKVILQHSEAAGLDSAFDIVDIEVIEMWKEKWTNFLAL